MKSTILLGIFCLFLSRNGIVPTTALPPPWSLLVMNPLLVPPAPAPAAVGAGPVSIFAGLTSPYDLPQLADLPEINVVSASNESEWSDALVASMAKKKAKAEAKASKKLLKATTPTPSASSTYSLLETKLMELVVKLMASPTTPSSLE